MSDGWKCPKCGEQNSDTLTRGDGRAVRRDVCGRCEDSGEITARPEIENAGPVAASATALQFSEAPLPSVTPPMPPVTGAMAKPSAGRISSLVEVRDSGVRIQTLEQMLQVAQYLVSGNAAPKGWTAAQVFLAMQAAMEHGLPFTSGITSFVIINNLPSWRGQAAVAKIRSSPICERGSLQLGVEDDPDAPGKIRGWCRGARVGDKAPTVRYFTEADAATAGLTGDTYKKFKGRMLMWRAVGFLTKDLFGDVLGNFPVAEEMFTPEQHDAETTPVRGSALAITASPTHDSLFDELGAGNIVPRDPIDIPRVTTDDESLGAQLRASVAANAATSKLFKQ